MASYLPIALLICLQLTGGLCQTNTSSTTATTASTAISGWQIAVIVLLAIILLLILLSFCIMIACGAKNKCKPSQCGGDVYIQDLGCRSQHQ